MTLPDGSMFETSEHDRLDRWLAGRGLGSGWVHRLEGSLPFIAVALALVAAVAFGAVQWGIPWVSRHIAQALPPDVSAGIASGTLETLDENVFTPTSLPVARRQTLLGKFQRLVPEDDGAIRFRLEFRGGGWIGANAFALPDGSIVITDELVRLAASDEEVLGVLVHEMGHVVHRHSLRLVISHSGLAMLSLLILGDLSSASSLVLALPSVLAGSAYSRDVESEADEYALSVMRAHGLDPVHLANLMERLDRCALGASSSEPGPTCRVDGLDDAASEDGWMRYLSSHPTSAERIARFRGTRPP